MDFREIRCLDQDNQTGVGLPASPTELHNSFRTVLQRTKTRLPHQDPAPTDDAAAQDKHKGPGVPAALAELRRAVASSLEAPDALTSELAAKAAAEGLARGGGEWDAQWPGTWSAICRVCPHIPDGSCPWNDVSILTFEGTGLLCEPGFRVSWVEAGMRSGSACGPLSAGRPACHLMVHVLPA